MIPAGKCIATATGAALSESTTGKEQLVIDFEIPELGERISSYHYFTTDKGAKYTVKALRVSGWTGDDITDLSSVTANRAEVELEIDHEEYEGKTRAKVKWVNAIGGAVNAKPLDPGKAASLQARMGGLIQQVTQELGQTAKNGAASDVPF